MDSQNFIQFKKRRDLGLMLSDAVKFLQIEWKPFFGTILKISIIPILIAICGVIYYVMYSTTFLGNLTQATSDNTILDFNFSELLIPMLLFFISYLIAYALITVSSLSYIKSYIVNKGIVDYEEVSNTTKGRFLTYVGLFFLNGLIVGFGALFCFLPGIYLGVVLSLSVCLLIFQNKSVTESISDSFSFIKDHWWETFGVLIVVQIIVGVIGLIIGLPASLYQSTDIGSLLQNENPTEVLNSFSDPIYLLLLAFSYFVNFILYIATTIITVFIYYDIKEQKDPSVDIINEIGVE